MLLLLLLLLLQPMAESDVTIEAWYMDDVDTDQRLPHRRVSSVILAGSAQQAGLDSAQ
jgi:hypothetical protein